MVQKTKTCGLNSLLDFIGKKWTYSIFTHINDDPITFNKLFSTSKHIINPTLLSSRLKEMVELKIIKKSEIKGKLSYVITDSGKDLKKIILNLKDWCVKNGCVIPDKCKGKDCICSTVFILQK
ncbi:helix-turn-helix transcriptional regulator [archaeon]|jgi:DNA-binding HxlR family transcriptional regulator|nr:helix-turn-helix transcriptional regulator [archaeon]